MNNTTILIVEDEAIVAADLAGKLSILGYEVIGTVASGEEAVEKACQLHPQLVLMDISLKGAKDGIEAAQDIRSQLDIPVIYLTANSDPATLARAKISEPFGYVHKPFDERELATTIEMALYRHQSDRKLRESEELFRVMFTESSVGKEIADPATGRIVQVNAAFCRMLGYSEEELYQLNFLDLHHPEDRERTIEAYSAMVCGEISGYHQEKRYLRPDGSIVWVNVVTNLIRDRSGRPWRSFTLVQDITDRKRVDESLRQASEELEMRVEKRTEELKKANIYNRSLIEANLDPLVTIGADGKITDVNAATEKITGRPRPELIGTDFCNYFTDPDHARAGYQKVFREGMVRDYPLELRHRDGRVTPVLYNSSVYRDEKGDVMGVFAAARDITERKRAEREQRESEERFSAVYQATPDLIAISRVSDGKILEVNEAFSRLLGYTRSEGIGKTTSELAIWADPADRVTFVSTLEATGQINEFEVMLRRKDGSLVICMDTARTIDFGGEKCVLSVVRDITERKRIDDTLRFIAQRGWAGTADTFLIALAGYLADTLGMDHVLIAHLLDDGYSVAETTALYAKGEILPNVRYELKGTPCENVAGKKMCLYTEGIQALFPEDNLLVDMGVESYAGIPLWDSAGRPIGLIAALDGKPLKDESTLSYILQLAATSAAAALERKQAEQEMALLATFPMLNPQPIMEVDLDGRVSFVNAAARRLFPDLESEGSGHPWLTNWEQLVTCCGNNGMKPDNREVAVAGRWYYQCMYYVPQEKRLRIYGFDITSQKQIGESLRLAGVYNRSLIEASLDPLVTIGPDGKITDVNAATEKITGRPRPELIGTDFCNYFTDPHHARAGYQKVFREGMVKDYPLELRHHDGSVTSVLYNASVYRDEKGDVTGVFAAARDITERKRAEQALAEREREFRSLAENTTDNIARYDRNGRTLYINPTLEKTIGIKLEDTLGKTPRERAAVNRFDDYIETLEKVVSSGVGDTLELTFPDGNGDFVHHQINFVPEYDQDGEMIGILAIGRDITDVKRSMHKLMEEQQRRAEMALELSVAEERERHAIATELHDRIGQDLALAKMRLGMLTKVANGEKVSSLLNGVRESLDNALYNVRTLTRRISPPILESGSLVAALKWLCRQVESDYGLQVLFDDDGNEESVSRDIRGEIYNAVRELLINVVKHAGATSARVLVGSDEGRLLVRVEDDGVGFDPLSVDACSTGEAGGFGLSNVRRRINRLGGTLRIESAPGDGCRISIGATVQPSKAGFPERTP